MASELCWELGFKPLIGMTMEAAAVEEQEAKLGQVLDMDEKRLSKSKYLACDCFTRADLYHLPTVQILTVTQSKKLFDALPHVGTWATDILAKPAWIWLWFSLRPSPPPKIVFLIWLWFRLGFELIAFVFDFCLAIVLS